MADRRNIEPAEVIQLQPGGIGKRGAQNWQALRALERVVALGPRVLVGTSRKRVLAELLTDASAAAGSGTTNASTAAPVDTARLDLATAVTSVLAAQAGVWAVRVHDVGATRDALAVARAWSGGAG